MKRIVLHIGLPKTGTTSIQEFLAANIGELAKQGAGFFIQPSRFVKVYGHANAIWILFSVLNKMGFELAGFQKEGLDEVFREFAAFCADHDTLILSCEDLYRPESYDPSIAPAYWRCVRDLLRSAAGEDCVIEPVLYLRRQDDWCESHWKMTTMHPVRNSMTPFEYAMWKYDYSVIDYDGFLSSLESVFGMENIRVRIYEDHKGRGSIESFIEAAGLRWDDSFKKKEAHENFSLSARSAWALREINLGNVRCSAPGPYVEKSAKRLTRKNPDKKGTHVMTADERQRLMALVEEGNRRVALRYFGREELFPIKSCDDGTFCGPDEKRDRRFARRIAILARLLIIRRKIKNR